MDVDNPPYLVVGGLVFTVVTVLYLRSEFGEDFERNSPVRLLNTMYSMAETEDRQVVVLSQILASDATTGYEPDDFYNLRVHSFNGQKVENLAALADMVEECLGGLGPGEGEGEYVEFEVGEHYKELIVLEKSKVAKATKDIMQQHSIPHAMRR